MSKQKNWTRTLSAEKTTNLVTYPQVFRYLLSDYATDENFEEREDEITLITQPTDNLLHSIYKGCWPKNSDVEVSIRNSI